MLINNVANDTRQAAAEVTPEAWRKGLAVNLDPAFIAATAVYPMMKAAGGGSIVNISSINAILRPAELPTYSPPRARSTLCQEPGARLGRRQHAGQRALARLGDHAAAAGALADPGGRGGLGEAGGAEGPDHARGHRPRWRCSWPPTTAA